MRKFYLFPKFPKVGDTPPTLDAIERENPKFAVNYPALKGGACESRLG